MSASQSSLRRKLSNAFNFSMYSWLLPWPDLRDGALQRSVPLRNRDTDWRRRRLGYFDDRFDCESSLSCRTRRRLSLSILSKNAVVGEIADTPGVHAFVAVPEVQRGFSSNGKESKSSVVDLTTLKTISKIDTGQNPDAVVYEPRHGEVYVFNHTGNSVTVINAKTASVSATIPLGGTPEFAAVDEAAGRIYCNIEDKSEVAVIDANKHRSRRALVACAGRRTKWNRFGCARIIVCSRAVTTK